MAALKLNSDRESPADILLNFSNRNLLVDEYRAMEQFLGQISAKLPSAAAQKLAMPAVSTLLALRSLDSVSVTPKELFEGLKDSYLKGLDTKSYKKLIGLLKRQKYIEVESVGSTKDEERIKLSELGRRMVNRAMRVMSSEERSRSVLRSKADIASALIEKLTQLSWKQTQGPPCNFDQILKLAVQNFLDNLLKIDRPIVTLQELYRAAISADFELDRGKLCSFSPMNANNVVFAPPRTPWLKLVDQIVLTSAGDRGYILLVNDV